MKKLVLLFFAVLSTSLSFGQDHMTQSSKVTQSLRYLLKHKYEDQAAVPFSKYDSNFNAVMISNMHDCLKLVESLHPHVRQRSLTNLYFCFKYGDSQIVIFNWAETKDYEGKIIDSGGYILFTCDNYFNFNSPTLECRLNSYGKILMCNYNGQMYSPKSPEGIKYQDMVNQILAYRGK